MGNHTLAVEELEELSRFWSEEGEAISLYFQPPVPSELAHREEPILAKENIQRKLKTLEGGNAVDRQDIRRLMECVAGLKGNHRRTRVVFACARQKLWREYDVAGDFGVRLDVDHAFMLAPLIAQQQSRRRYCIALADRNRARLLLLEAREIAEHSQVLDEEQEKIRTTGARKSVHIERKKEEKVRQHFCFLADHLLHFYEHGDYDGLLIGCRDDMWPEIEAALHPELKRILAGRFAADPGVATRQEVAEKAQALVDEKDRRDEQALVEKVMGAAASDGLGAVGLDAVIGALERGEVRTLLWPRSIAPAAANAPRAASLCPNCGHLDSSPVRACSLCGAGMRRFARAQEALLRHALGRSIEVRMLAYTKLPPPHEIGAWLRFLAHHNTARALAS